jgi:iron(II)-dependent oxidoreductase
MSFQDPYKFLKPFREEDQEKFFGRTEEVDHLLTCLQKAQLVLLYAKPGLGKTSLLKAGLSPALKTKGYFPIYVPVVRDPLAALWFVLQEKLGTSIEFTSSTTLANLLGEVARSVKRPLVVLFDRFEHFLVSSSVSMDQDATGDLPPSTAHSLPANFWKEVLFCLNSSFRIAKFLFCLREEFLAEFYSVQGQIPTIFNHGVRLTRLTTSQAREILQYSVEQKGFSYTGETLEQIIAFLAKPDGIHPLDLQIVHYGLLSSLRPEGAISADVQRNLRSPEAILTGYIEQSLQHFSKDRHPLVLEILNRLAQVYPGLQPLPVEDLARQLQEPISTVRDVLVTLEDSGLVQGFNEKDLESHELARSCLIDVLQPFFQKQEQFIQSLRDELYQFCQHYSTSRVLRDYNLLQIFSRKNPRLKLIPEEKELLELRNRMRIQRRHKQRREVSRKSLRRGVLVLLLISLVYLGLIIAGVHSFYFDVSPNDHQTIRIMRGRPAWNIGLLPRLELERTGYTLQDIEKKSDITGLLKREVIEDIHRWKEQLIPKLSPLQKGIAYRELGKNSEAIQVLQSLLESPQLPIARRAAAELAQLTPDEGILLKAREVVIKGGGGNSLNLLNGIKQNAPPYLQRFIAETREKLIRDWMVFVPGGEFLMGSSEGNEDEKPPHKVYVSDFYVDKYEVTNAQYQEFVDIVGLKFSPRHWISGRYESGKGSHPVANITWYQAKGYCEWVGKRLPTEAEWEKAARGSDNRIYSWGNQLDPSKANVKDSGKLDTVPVGSYEGGRNPYGAYDMSGNVWEWTSSLKMSYPYKMDDDHESLADKGPRVIRGGAFDYYIDSARTVSRRYFEPQNTGFNIGFRCARNISE